MLLMSSSELTPVPSLLLIATVAFYRMHAGRPYGELAVNWRVPCLLAGGLLLGQIVGSYE